MPNTRQADDSLRGYHYQFLKTTLEILSADDTDTVIVEGIVEDIDIISATGAKAIQCKYHESKDNFTLSLIYKPVLQMMSHYNSHRGSSIEYILFLYINSTEEIAALTADDLSTILRSSNQKLKALIASIPADFPKDDFLLHMKIIKGESLSQLEAKVKTKIVENGLEADSIEELYYPNAINFIGELSRKPSDAERHITKSSFLDLLRNTHNTLYTKWIVAAKGKQSTLSIIRKQLAATLGHNNRQRGIIIGNCEAKVWGSVIDIITAFVGKYAFKPMIHTNEPIFLLDVEWSVYQEFLAVLVKYHPRVHICEIGTAFNVGRAKQKSYYVKEANTRDFFFKIARLNDDSKQYIESTELNDLYIISSEYTPPACVPGVQIYKYDMSHANEVKYILGVRDTYE